MDDSKAVLFGFLGVFLVFIVLIVAVNWGNTIENIAKKQMETSTDGLIQTTAIRAGLCQIQNIGNSGYHWDKCK